METTKLVSLGVLLAFLSQGSAPIQGQDASPPLLAISRVDQESIALTWSNTPSRFVVQATDSLSDDAPWRGIPELPCLENGFLTVTQAVSGSRFFRLVAQGNSAAMDYLLANQNDDGTWGDPSGSWFRDTSGIVESLALIAPTDPALAGGVSALAYRTPRNNDDLARQIVALASGGWDTGAPATSLLESQNTGIVDTASPSYPGQGWGLAPGFGNSILDTALALRALKSSGTTAGLCLVNEALAGLAGSPGYAFEVPDGSSQLVLRVRRIGGTVQFRITYPDGTWSVTLDLSAGSVPSSYSFLVQTGISTLNVENRTASPASFTAELGFTTADGSSTFRVTTPLTYLGLAQNADGGWGIQPGRDSHFMITAEVLRCLAGWKPAFAGQQVIQSAVAWLRSHQNPDGGFGSDPGTSNVPETSLATQAILAVDPGAWLATAAAYLKNAQLPDGSWASNAYQTAVAIQALRMPPVVSPIPGQSVTVSAAFVPIPLDNFVADPDHADAQLSWTVSGNSNLVVNISNRVATVLYPPGIAVREVLVFTAADPDGFVGSATATFTVALMPDQPPVASPISNQTVRVPAPFAPINWDDFVTDPDNSDAEIVWTVSGNTDLAVSISNRVALITYLPNYFISEQLTFTATDPAGSNSSAAAIFTVLPNQPPVVSPIPNHTARSPNPFAPINLDDYVTDPDNSDAQIVWTISEHSQLTVSISNRVATISYLPGTPISEQLTFTARDPVGSRSSVTVTFTVTFQPNQPPVVSSIPGQAADVPASFTPISLDDYAADPDHADAQLTWAATNNTLLTVSITNRVATIGYPTNTTTSFSESLIFTATDPEGLSGSTTSLFSVVFLPVDYTIARRGSTPDFRLITSSAAVMQQANTVDFSKASPPYVGYEMHEYSLASDTQLRIDYRISISATASLGTAQLVVTNRVLNFLNQPLSPLTNHIFNFRIRVTP